MAKQTPSRSKDPNVKDLTIIDASPTKDLFITMLIRDLTLRDAIGDLVDNSVDGAKSIGGAANFHGLKILIEAKSDRFTIEDNCGGFSDDIAREYAFRFGRNSDAPVLANSIGQFGIGMKRALFKLGNFFSIDSRSESSRFKINVNVSEWQKTDDWEFKFAELEKKKVAAANRGTKIEVTQLREDASNSFADENFIKKLKVEIEREHLFSINKGLEIKINNTKLNPRELDFIHSQDFKTAYWFHDFPNDMKVEIYAGISEDKGEDGGWYIFCNERLILGPDTTSVTGWTGKGKDGVAEYHDQFHRFRGYVFFTARNSSLLPWNTTKTSMDMDSPVYQSVRRQMINMMRPIMTLMNSLKREKESDVPEKDRILNHKIRRATVEPVHKVIKLKSKLSHIFSYPEVAKKVKKGDDVGKITYQKSNSHILKVKEHLGLTTNQEVGEYTFDYFFQNEIEE